MADTLDPVHTVGLDNSENFLAHDLATAFDKVSFHLHDITEAPFPEAPFDLIFSRFVLTHLRDPEAAIALWGDQIRPRGLLLIEEVEHINTSGPEFDTYLNIQQAMLTKQNNELYIGPRLDGITASDKLQRRATNVSTLQVPINRAAAMFHMNLGVWRHNDFVRQTYAPATLDNLEQSLHAIAQDRRNTQAVKWQLRQIVMERAAP